MKNATKQMMSAYARRFLIMTEKQYKVGVSSLVRHVKSCNLKAMSGTRVRELGLHSINIFLGTVTLQSSPFGMPAKKSSL